MTFTYTFPEITEQVMPNGMRMLWIPDFNQPVLTVSLQVPFGRLHDPVSCEGTAEATAQCMIKGVPFLTTEEFTEKFEHAGAMLHADVKDEYTVFGTRMLVKAADELVPLFWNMIINPAFEAKELRRIKKEMLTGLQTESADPNSLTRKHFYAELFGSSHPAGRYHSLQSIKRISSEGVKSFYELHSGPQESILVIAGAMDVAQMQTKWKDLFLAWQKETKRSESAINTIPLNENRIRIIDKPDFSQTTLLLGHPAVTELHERKIALSLANYILGGGNFSSRLMARIRTETGQTYGIASNIHSHKRFGAFAILTATQNTQLKSVIMSIIDVYREFVEKSVSETELEKARQFALGSIAFELEGINNVVEKLLWLRFYNRGNAYIESLGEQIAQINSTLVKETLQKHFKYDSFVIIAVGKQKDITPQLEHLGSIWHFHARENPLRKE